ncbi:MBL fold metallo-hydrolase [Leucothrix pacifica]|uniref:MBL fold metallo-hydrolase n=1 Tax=Leucothrix pacifica TaxID=1247513 RepID=A0A317C976_9GAMM|nr:MBL fold metallo-hydrolase [Leucothrix pacifica]PWQ95078.1 MBL fold metallo-hydrolase [Leucothrix pacifica]
MTYRQLLPIAMLLLGAVIIGHAADRKPLDGYEAKKISDNTWVIHGPTESPNPENLGFMNNPAFTVTDNSVIVFDPGATKATGEGVLQRIKEQTNNPVTHVFITHVHGDHWLGNHAIKNAYPDAKFYAHPIMIELAKGGAAYQWVSLMEQLTNGASKGTEAVIPEVALSDEQEVKIDNITVRAYLSEWAHSKSDAMFVIVEDKVLLTGDNVMSKRIARMNDGSFRGNIDIIEAALDYDIEVVIPGHGPSDGKEVLESFKQYLSAIYAAAEAAVEDELEAHEVKSTLAEQFGDYKDWPGFENEFGRHISLAILEAEDASF